MGCLINASRLHRRVQKALSAQNLGLVHGASNQCAPLIGAAVFPCQNTYSGSTFYIERRTFARMESYDWSAEFRETYDAATARYEAGERNPAKLFSAAGTRFLASIGCTAQELYDFIDDLARYGEPSFESALLVAGVRRDYFLIEQNGIPSGHQIDMDALPAKTAEVDGIAWLPRLIPKARAKLRGEMPADLMYGCGGDRPFLRGMNTDLAEFLHVVWRAGADDRQIIDYVKKRRAAAAQAR